MYIVHFAERSHEIARLLRGESIATTRIIPIHKNKGKTLAQCLHDRTAYAMNPEKMQERELISAYECDPQTVESEFLLSKREYGVLTGRQQKNDVIAYQIRQPFKPGEVTPEEANRIGYEFAMRFLKSGHAFIVCTHTDKAHIHNQLMRETQLHSPVPSLPPITVGEQLSFSKQNAVSNGANGVDHILAGQTKNGSGCRLPDLTATESAACLQQFWPGRAMDSAVYSIPCRIVRALLC